MRSSRSLYCSPENRLNRQRFHGARATYAAVARVTRISLRIGQGVRRNSGRFALYARLWCVARRNASAASMGFSVRLERTVGSRYGLLRPYRCSAVSSMMHGTSLTHDRSDLEVRRYIIRHLTRTIESFSARHWFMGVAAATGVRAV